MNQLDYVVAITEDADTLFTLERQARHPKERQRLQLVRLLKSGLAMTMPEAAALVGISHSSAECVVAYGEHGILNVCLARLYCEIIGLCFN
ncbi:MAG: hypothetical protein ACOVSW_14730 [Candidatus Kapaibacteriota bacterium]